MVQRKRVKRRHRRKPPPSRENGWWVNQENEGAEGKARKQRQAEMRAGELWDNYNVVTLSHF